MEEYTEHKETNSAVGSIQTKAVPTMVFGGLADAAAKMTRENDDGSSSDEKRMGVLERLRMAATANANK